LAQLLIEERRRYPRCPIQLPLLYRSRDPSSVAAGAGWTQNLCRGGALVELAEHLLPQTPLSLLLQTDEGSVGVEAQVVWTRAHVALGGVLHAVTFTQRLPEPIQDLLLTQGEARIPRVRLPTDLDVTCWSKGAGRAPIQGRAADAGRGGLLLCLPETLPLGTLLELSLHTSEVPVITGGTIVWVEPPDRRAPGALVRHGVQFTSVSMTVLLALGLFLVEPR
jgi:hypothetical protein